MSTLVRWETVGSAPPRDLSPARLLLHHAAQLPSAVGRSLVPARPDDGHTSLEWHGASGQLVGAEVGGPRPLRAALRPRDLSLAVLADGAQAGRLSLAGRTRAEAFDWLVSLVHDLGAPADRLEMAVPFTLPEHAVGTGAPFALPGPGELEEVARWLANADTLLRAVAREWPASAPVRVWPHHFDIGSVLPLAGRHGEEAPSIGVGLSPGDDGIPEPYFYVTPWPPPSAASLPALPAGGRWNVQGWIGAVLTGSDIVAAGGGGAQAAGARAFLAGTLEALRRWDAPGQAVGS